MTAKLGRIAYLNTEPFFGDDAVRSKAVAAVPRRLIELALAGDIDIAPLPVVAALDHPHTFEPVGAFGIAATSEAQSVLLYARVPVPDLEGCAIGVTDETATSVRLLRILLHERFGLTHVRFVGLQDDADGYLVIGDRVLRDGAPRAGLPYVVDLAGAWSAWTGLPFVFAYWMARQGTPPADQAAAAEYFDACLTRNLADPSILARRRPDLGLSQSEIAAYLGRFEFRLNARAWASVEHFRDLDGRVSAREHAA